MKKRLLSLLLSVVMVLALLPVKTYAADGHTHNYEKGICECGAHNGEHGEWTEWTQTASLPAESGYFYLAADVALTSTWQVPTGTTYLCLNGHLISPVSGVDPISLVSVPNGATLNLYDCSTEKHFYKVGSDGLWTLDTGATEGTPFDSLTARPDADTVIEVPGGCITGGEKSEDNFAAGAVTVAAGGAFNMHGGNIIGNSNTNRGGAVFVSGSFTLTSGNILGNLATGDGDYTGGGAGVCVSGGTFTMTGGNISFNTVPNYAAGGIMVLDISGGSFIMSDGNIKYNYANGNGGGVCTNRLFTMTGGCIEGNVSSAGGGGVRITAKGSMTATGGQIVNNSSTLYGGGVNTEGTVTLGGTIKINGNKKGTGSSAVTQNIFLPSGKTVTVATGDDAPAEGMSVGVTLAGESGVFTDTVTDVTYFVSDNARYCVMEKNSKLYITNSWAELNSALSATGDPETVEGLFKVENGIIKLLSDISAGPDDNNLVVDGTKSLDLNGHVLKGNGSKNILTINKDATLNLSDTDTATKHYFKVGSDGLWTLDTGATEGTPFGSLTARPDVDTVIEVVGGCITGGKSKTNDVAGGVSVSQGGVFTMNGGNLVGNSTAFRGGAVYVYKGAFNLKSGNILGNLAMGSGDYDGGGAGVCVNGGTLTMAGGNISFNTVPNYAAGGIMVLTTSGGSFTMSDGNIKYNYANGNGGGVCTNCRFTMTGGCIEGNVSTAYGGGVRITSVGSMTATGGRIINNSSTSDGGGVNMAGTAVTLGGTIKINGNKKGTGSSAVTQNIFLPKGKTVTVAAPTDDMSVGITTATAPTATVPVAFTGENSADYHKNFFPDAGRLLQDVSYVSKKLYLSIPKISVSQTGTNLVYGTAMPSNEFYSVSTNGFGDAPDLKLEWKSGTGTSTVWGDDAPAGITADLTNGKISIATDATLNAGTYTFRVTNGEDEFTTGTTKNPMFVTSAETVFTVGKASLTVTAKDKSIIYGEAPANDGVEYSGFVNSETADVLGGKLVYAYSANGTAYVSGGSVGTYDIIPSGLSSDNYEITFEKGSLKVDRRQLTVTGTEVEAQRIYDGTVVINVSSIGDLGNIANSDSVTLSATAACADAGAGKDKQVTVTYTISGTKADNYIAPAADSSFTTEIIKATPTVSAPTALSIGVHSITLNEQSGPCGTEYGYNTVNETPSAWQESTEFTGLDKLTAYYFFTKFKGNENYNEAVSAGRSITTADPNHQHVWSFSASGNMITAECGNSDGEHDGSLTSTLTLVAPTLTTYAETGKSAEVTVSGEIAGVSTPDVEYYKGSIRLGAAPTEAGSYTAKLTVGDATAVLDYVIGKANAVITVDTTPIVKDFGEAVTLPAAGSNFGTVSCDKTAEKLVNAGSYTVTYEVSDSDNYNGDIKTVSVTINKLAVDEPAVTGTYVYNGSEQDAVVSGKEIFMTETGDTAATNAGSYTIVYTLDGNHYWADGSDGTVIWSIAKTAQTAPAAPEAENKYDAGVTLKVQSGQGMTLYGCSTSDMLPSAWQESPVISGLTESTTYYFFVKFAGNSNYLEAVSSGTQITTDSSVCAHSDVDKDHYCDICNEKISEHIDVDRDHLCDICLMRLSSHDDANHDHYCDLCRIKMSDHHDADNHYCDFCGIKLTEHYDNNKDYICDLCGFIYPEKAEADSRETNVISVDSDNRITTDAINEMIDSIIENGETELVISTDGKTEGGSQSGSDGKTGGGSQSGSDGKTEGGSDEVSVTEKLGLEKAAIKTLAKADGIDSVTIQTDVADIKLSAACIDSLNSRAEGDVTLSVSRTVKDAGSESGNVKNEKNSADEKVYYNFSLTDEKGNEITTLDRKKITITVPVPAELQVKDPVCVFSDGEGHYSPVKGKVNKDGTITFETNYIAEVVIMSQNDADESYNYIHDMQTLNVHVKKCTDTTVTIEWGDYSYADGYIVYGSYCNEGDEKHTVRKLATIKDPSATEYTISGLESGQYYKFRVTAYRQVNGKYGVVKSYLVHARTSENGKDGNDSVDIEINDIRKNGISLKKKETYVIDANQYNPDGIKFRHVGVRYESSDTSVATVAKDGKIKAVGKGKCLIYVFAENGVREEIKVTVK